MEIWILFAEFFKTGLFAVGGGLATLPFLYDMADKYDWFTKDMIADMIAISESTPGPMGINMATYTGFQNMGVLGSIIATVGLVMPSIIIIIWVSKFLEKFRNNLYVERVFSTLRPTVTGLIASAGFAVLVQSLFRIEAIQNAAFASFIKPKECILFVVFFVLMNKFDKHPIFYIALAAIVGILFHF